MTSRWPLAAWVMAGLLAVIAVAAPNIPDGRGDQVRADLTMVGDTGDGANARPDRLAFDDGPERGIDTAANVLSPSPIETVESDPSAPNPERQATSTSMNPESRPTSTNPGSTSTADDGGGAGSTDQDGEEGDPITGGADPAVDGEKDDDQNSPTGGNKSLVERYYNDFSSGSLDDDNWDVDDSPSPTGLGMRRPAAVSVVVDSEATGGHVLQITATMGSGLEDDQVVAGAMRLIGFGQTYGRYRARVRIDTDPDQVTSGALVLTAADSGGRDERISFFETWANRSTRTPVETYLHQSEDEESPFLVQTHPGISGNEWHTYTVDWRKDGVTVSVDDGQPVILSTDQALIPDEDLELSIRLDAYDSPVAPGRSPELTGPVRLQIDWLRIESRG